MKNSFFLFLLLVFFFSACEEECIEIPEIQAGNRAVLVEEITGVRCQACPLGSAELVRLDSIHGENLIVVSVHAAGSFSFPYTANEFPPNGGIDFRSSEADELALYLGDIQGYPTASFDRHIFNQQLSPFVTSAGTWGGFVAQRLQAPAEATMTLDANYSAGSRDLSMDVSIFPEKNLTGDIRLTVMITEDHIINPQKDGTITIEDYDHRHVLRKIVTAPLGETLSETFTAGSEIKRSYTFKIPEEWVANNCSVVAFTHENNGDKRKDVLQAVEVHLEE